MRVYETNSREAVGRLLALTMITDGDMARCEAVEMANTDVYRRLGLTEAEFRDLLDQLCTDLLDNAEETEVRIGMGMVDRLLLEVADTRLREDVLAAMQRIAEADGRIHESESILLKRAAVKWSQ